MSRQIPAFVTKHACLERMWNFGMFVMERIDKASLKQVASSLTLTTLLSIVPALAVIMAAFSAFPLFAPYREAFEQFIFSTLLPAQYSEQILGYIKQFATQAAGLTAFGLIGLVISALLCIATIDSALNALRSAQAQKLMAKSSDVLGASYARAGCHRHQPCRFIVFNRHGDGGPLIGICEVAYSHRSADLPVDHSRGSL